MMTADDQGLPIMYQGKVHHHTIGRSRYRRHIIDICTRIWNPVARQAEAEANQEQEQEQEQETEQNQGYH